MTAIGAPSGGGVGRGRSHASRPAAYAPTSCRAMAQRKRGVGGRARVTASTRGANGGPRPGELGKLTGAQLLCRWRARGTDARGTDARGTDARGTDPRGTDARGTKARAHTTPRDGPVGGRQRARAQSGPIRCIVRIGNTTRTDRAVVLATKRAGRPGGRPGDDSDRTYRDDSDRTYRDDSAAKADVSVGCGRAGPRHQSAGTACSGAGAGLRQEAGAHNGAVGALAAAGRSVGAPAPGNRQVGTWRRNKGPQRDMAPGCHNGTNRTKQKPGRNWRADSDGAEPGAPGVGEKAARNGLCPSQKGRASGPTRAVRNRASSEGSEPDKGRGGPATTE